MKGPKIERPSQCQKCLRSGYFKLKTAVCLGCSKKIRICPTCFPIFTNCGKKECETRHREKMSSIMESKIGKAETPCEFLEKDLFGEKDQ